MKLVDILARELKEWPANQPCLWISDAHTAEVYGKSGSHEIRISGEWSCPEDYLDAIVYKAEWQAAVDALKAEKVVEWTGEGLPPAGTVCEWHPNNDGWVQVEILGHSGEETWFRRDGHESSEICLRMVFFRPIRTPEQIAAEEREAEILEIFHATGLRKRDGGMEIAENIHRAGYRKQVQP